MKPVVSLLLALQLTAGEVRFVDISMQAGLTYAAICGNNDKKTYLIETLGTGFKGEPIDSGGMNNAFAEHGSLFYDLLDHEKQL